MNHCLFLKKKLDGNFFEIIIIMVYFEYLMPIINRKFYQNNNINRNIIANFNNNQFKISFIVY